MVDAIWHSGEIELQRRIGVEGKMAEIGERVIRSYMPEQHRSFFSQLPFIVIGSVDDNGNAWAGIRSGDSGFIDSPNSRRLRIFGKGIDGDPTEVGIRENADIGLLGIEFDTRRRNRMNGLIQVANDEWVDVHVEQSFGNCPKYIHEHYIESLYVKPSPVEISCDLTNKIRTLIESSETFFVSSYSDMNGKRQVDVSHRGGEPGFVKVDDSGVLTVPDFIGNNFFSTLGNIYLNNRAGLTFFDFKDKLLLQMTGIAEILKAGNVALSNDEAERFWQFKPEKIVCRSLLVNGGDK